jgi:hypothetical protein
VLFASQCVHLFRVHLLWLTEERTGLFVVHAAVASLSECEIMIRIDGCAAYFVGPSQHRQCIRRRVLSPSSSQRPSIALAVSSPSMSKRPREESPSSVNRSRLLNLGRSRAKSALEITTLEEAAFSVPEGLPLRGLRPNESSATKTPKTLFQKVWILKQAPMARLRSINYSGRGTHPKRRTAGDRCHGGGRRDSSSVGLRCLRSLRCQTRRGSRQGLRPANP